MSLNRYSDADLMEFKIKIEEKLAKSKEQLRLFEGQIEDINDSKSNEGDWMDDTSNMQDLEFLSAMASRQIKHINDLENALIRINNKNYGICIITGQLIDKKRLMAVLTTTKSLAAKNQLASENNKSLRNNRPSSSKSNIISKVIRPAKKTTPLENTSTENYLEGEDNFSGMAYIEDELDRLAHLENEDIQEEKINQHNE